MTKFTGDFKYFVDGESVTLDEVKKFIDLDMSVTIDGLTVHFISPKKEENSMKGWSEPTQIGLLAELTREIKDKNAAKKELQKSHDKYVSIFERIQDAPIPAKKDKIQELLKEADEHQKQNGGRAVGMEFPFDAPTKAEKDWNEFIVGIKEKEIIDDWNKIDLIGLIDIPKFKIVQSEIGEKTENKIRVNFYRYENGNPKVEVKEFINLNSAKSYFKFSEFEEAFYYSCITKDLIEKEDKNSDFSISGLQEKRVGIKESQTVKKAPIFTYCKQMKNAIEALSLRSLYGHEKYEKGDDWENFSRVENGDFEYANAAFRHALGIGEDSERDHRIAEAWNAVAKLEIYLRNNLELSK